MKEGTIIYCDDQEDLKATLKELCDAGYGAVTYSPGSFIIVITSVPDGVRNEKE